MPEVWPFPPLTPLAETLTFATDRLATAEGQQRVAAMALPRQSLAFSHRLLPHDLARADAVFRANAGGEWYVPAWHEGTRVSDVASAATTISMATANAEYAVGGRALVWQDSENYALAVVSEIASGLLTFTAPVGVDLVAPFVMPVFDGFARGGLKRARADDSHADLEVSFERRGGTDLAAVNSPQYLSLDIVTDRPLASGRMSDRIAQPVDYFDNGVGVVALQAFQDYLDATQDMVFRDVGRAATWARRQWLHRQRGRQRAFWQPTWHRDFTATETIGSASVGVTVRKIGGSSVGRHVLILLRDGTMFARQITGVTLGASTDVLTISAALGQAVEPADIQTFCFLNKSSLGTDRVTLTHHLAGWSEASFSTTEVPA